MEARRLIGLSGPSPGGPYSPVSPLSPGSSDAAQARRRCTAEEKLSDVWLEFTYIKFEPKNRTFRVGAVPISSHQLPGVLGVRVDKILTSIGPVQIINAAIPAPITAMAACTFAARRRAGVAAGSAVIADPSVLGAHRPHGERAFPRVLADMRNTGLGDDRRPMGEAPEPPLAEPGPPRSRAAPRRTSRRAGEAAALINPPVILMALLCEERLSVGIFKTRSKQRRWHFRFSVRTLLEMDEAGEWRWQRAREPVKSQVEALIAQALRISGAAPAGPGTNAGPAAR